MPKKPEQRWNTGLHFAIRDDKAEPALGERAECFDLHFADGYRGRAELGLTEQRVDAQSLNKDPELAMAVRAWLIARGQRAINLTSENGTSVMRGPIAPADFDAVHPCEPGQARLVSLAPSNYDLLEALDLCDARLLACEDSTTPAAGLSPLRLGPDLNPDLDAVQSLGPSLVLASLTVPGMERVVMGLRRLGLPHLVFAPRTLDAVEDDLGRLGAAVGIDASRAQGRYRELRDSLLQQSSRRSRPVRVFLQWWPRPQFSPGADCYSNELIALAGGVNIFAHRAGSSLEVSAKEVAQQDPEVAFVSWCGVHLDKLDPSRLAQHPEYAQLDFIRESRVYALDEALSGRPGPKVLLAAQVMAQYLSEYAEKNGL